MSTNFLLKEIEAGELHAVKFGREWRVPILAACTYLESKGWPLPARLAALCAQMRALEAPRRATAKR